MAPSYTSKAMVFCLFLLAFIFLFSFFLSSPVNFFSNTLRCETNPWSRVSLPRIKLLKQTNCTSSNSNQLPASPQQGVGLHALSPSLLGECLVLWSCSDFVHDIITTVISKLPCCVQKTIFNLVTYNLWVLKVILHLQRWSLRVWGCLSSFSWGFACLQKMAGSDPMPPLLVFVRGILLDTEAPSGSVLCNLLFSKYWPMRVCVKQHSLQDLRLYQYINASLNLHHRNIFCT